MPMQTRKLYKLRQIIDRRNVSQIKSSRNFAHQSLRIAFLLIFLRHLPKAPDFANNINKLGIRRDLSQLIGKFIDVIFPQNSLLSFQTRKIAFLIFQIPRRDKDISNDSADLLFRISRTELFRLT